MITTKSVFALLCGLAILCLLFFVFHFDQTIFAENKLETTHLANINQVAAASLTHTPTTEASMTTLDKPEEVKQPVVPPTEAKSDTQTSSPKETLEPKPIQEFVTPVTIQNDVLTAEMIWKEQRRTEILANLQDLSEECIKAINELEEERNDIPKVKLKEINTEPISASVMQGAAAIQQQAAAEKARIDIEMNNMLLEANRMTLENIAMRQNAVIQYCNNEDYKLKLELQGL